MAKQPKRKTQRRKTTRRMTVAEARRFLDETWVPEQNAIAAHNLAVFIRRVVTYAMRKRIDLQAPDILARADRAREVRKGGRTRMVAFDGQWRQRDAVELAAKVHAVVEKEREDAPSYLKESAIRLRAAQRFTIVDRAVEKTPSLSWMKRYYSAHEKAVRTKQ